MPVGRWPSPRAVLPPKGQSGPGLEARSFSERCQTTLSWPRCKLNLVCPDADSHKIEKLVRKIRSFLVFLTVFF